MAYKSEGRVLCEDYCRVNPTLKDLTLAKKIFNENRRKFLNVERVRNLIRSIRGHRGDRSRLETADTSLYTPLTHDTRPPKNYKEEVNTGAKILLLDIETAPISAYVWNIWNQNIGTNMIVQDWFCLTWSAKWLFENTVYSGKLTPGEVKKQNDKRIMRGIWEMVNQADLIITHNGEKFDMPRLNSRFIINGLQPPLPYQNIDTLKHIRRQFGFVSNKLDYVNKLLNLQRKSDTGGFELWERCMQGEQAALDEMEKYNINDVRILEETYLHIRAWIKPHPNMGLFILDETQHRCPTCGSEALKSMGKPYYTTVNAFEVFRCDNCGAAGRKRTTELKLKPRKQILQSIAK